MKASKRRFKWKRRNRGATKGLPDYPKTLKGATGFPPEPWETRGNTTGDYVVSVLIGAVSTAVGIALGSGIVFTMFYFSTQGIGQ